MSNEVKSTQYIGGKIEKVNIINNMPVQDGSISNGGISGEDYTEFKNAASRSTENAADIADLTAAQESDHAEIGELKEDLINIEKNVIDISNVEAPLNIYSSAEYVDGKGFATWNNTLQNLSGYGYAELNVVPNTKVTVFNLSETLSSYGYGIKDGNGNVIQKGGESDGLTITIPKNAKSIIFTIPKKDVNRLILLMYYPLNKHIEILDRVVYEKDLIPNNSYTNDSVLFDVSQGKLAQHPYSETMETLFVDVSDISNGTLLLTNYPENTSTYGYGFIGKDWNVFSYGTFEKGNNYLEKPIGSTLLAISIRKDAVDTIGLKYTVNDMTKNDVIIIGDSWSDTNADHTDYVKWPVYFEKWIRCNLHNYAMNGSRVYGEDDFALNGTHGGQVAEAIQDTSFSHNNVSLIIIEGSINDYNHGNTVEQVVSAFTSHINRLHTEFQNAKIVCVLNHQISITKKLFDYMQAIKNGIKANTACPAYTSFGWLTPNNYISDRVHPNDNGYIQFASNVIAAALGGDITFYNNTDSKSATSTNGATITLTIEEIFSNERIDRNIKLDVSGATGSGSSTVEFDGNNLICCMGFDSFPQLIVESLNVDNIRTSIVRCTTNPNVEQQRTIPISIGHAELNGTYVGNQIPTIYC